MVWDKLAGFPGWHILTDIVKKKVAHLCTLSLTRSNGRFFVIARSEWWDRLPACLLGMTGKMKLSQNSRWGSKRATIEAVAYFATLTPTLSQREREHIQSRCLRPLALWERVRVRGFRATISPSLGILRQFQMPVPLAI